MIRFTAVVALAFAVATLSFAQENQTDTASTTIKGYVVDAMCAKGMARKGNVMERAAAHTKECALEEACAASGYGIFTEGKWHKFDEKGDALAKAAIEESKRQKGLLFEVSGMQEKERFIVASLKEAEGKKKEGPKK